jgi:hypothetical protein
MLVYLKQLAQVLPTIEHCQCHATEIVGVARQLPADCGPTVSVGMYACTSWMLCLYNTVYLHVVF